MNGFRPGTLAAFAALFISHGISFVSNYLLKGEYLHATSLQLMLGPYSRIAVLQIAIIFGAILTIVIGSPLAILIVLVILKTIIDIKLHLRERQKFGSLYLAKRKGIKSHRDKEC